MTNYTQGPATCKHPSIVAWTLAEGDDDGEPAGLWSCRDCGHKFYPWTAVEEAVRAEVKGLQDKLGETQGWLKAAEAVISRLNGERTDLLSRLDSLRQNLAVAHSILNDAMAEQDYHVDVSRAAVWLASNEGVVERHNTNPCGNGCALHAGHAGAHRDLSGNEFLMRQEIKCASKNC